MYVLYRRIGAAGTCVAFIMLVVIFDFGVCGTERLDDNLKFCGPLIL
jgi:hypothetical protein